MKELKFMNWDEWTEMNELKWMTWDEWIQMNERNEWIELSWVELSWIELKWRNWLIGWLIEWMNEVKYTSNVVNMMMILLTSSSKSVTSAAVFFTCSTGNRALFMRSRSLRLSNYLMTMWLPWWLRWWCVCHDGEKTSHDNRP